MSGQTVVRLDADNLRVHVAVTLAAALLGSMNRNQQDPDEVAAEAVRYADALLAELERTPP